MYVSVEVVFDCYQCVIWLCGKTVCQCVSSVSLLAVFLLVYVTGQCDCVLCDCVLCDVLL